jgi:hypothetical protein
MTRTVRTVTGTIAVFVLEVLVIAGGFLFVDMFNADPTAAFFALCLGMAGFLIWST